MPVAEPVAPLQMLPPPMTTAISVPELGAGLSDLPGQAFYHPAVDDFVGGATRQGLS